MIFANLIFEICDVLKRTSEQNYFHIFLQDNRSELASHLF